MFSVYRLWERGSGVSGLRVYGVGFMGFRVSIGFRVYRLLGEGGFGVKGLWVLG